MQSIYYTQKLFFSGNSFAVAAHAHKLSSHKLLFSDINWSQFFSLGLGMTHRQ